MAFVSISNKSPSQLRGGPGKTGRKLPNTPNNIRKSPSSNNTISMLLVFEWVKIAY
jgi:hypothetical protein